MFKNYLTVALRNVKRHKGFSVINIAGLAAGMAASILIAVFVFHEPFGQARMLAFPLIWLALVLYSYSLWDDARRNRVQLL